MKNKTKIWTLVAACWLASLYVGCLKGEDGGMGPPGTDGTDGTNGLSGDAKCQVCHNDSTYLLAKILQYKHSTHSQGVRTDRSAAACARCHTHEGFVSYVSTGIDSFPGGVKNPTPQNCRTCHMIHTNYDTTDFRFRVPDTAQVLIRSTGDRVSYGKGNVCANCHQPRTSYPIPNPTLAAADSVNVTSNRYGPHYGIPATILKGLAGANIPGSAAYVNSEHAIRATDACVDCHMPKQVVGLVAGGHTLNISYVNDETGATTLNLQGCATCHLNNTVRNLNYKLVQDTITMLTDSLRRVLVAKNVLDTASLAVRRKYSGEMAAVIWNFQTVSHDKSVGNHNYPYTKALLINSLEAAARY